MACKSNKVKRQKSLSTHSALNLRVGAATAMAHPGLLFDLLQGSTVYCSSHLFNVPCTEATPAKAK